MTDYRSLLLSFIASLTQCDNISDVTEEIDFVLKEIGLDLGDWSDPKELAEALARHGITTLRGMSLTGDDDETTANGD